MKTLLSSALFLLIVISCGNPPNNTTTVLGGQGGATAITPTPILGSTPTPTPYSTPGLTPISGTSSTPYPTPTPGGNTLTYTKDVAPIMSSHGCVGCHSQYGTYSGVAGNISGIIMRVANDNMPQGPNKLSIAEKQILGTWASEPGKPQ